MHLKGRRFHLNELKTRHKNKKKKKKKYISHSRFLNTDGGTAKCVPEMFGLNSVMERANVHR